MSFICRWRRLRLQIFYMLLALGTAAIWLLAVPTLIRATAPLAPSQSASNQSANQSAPSQSVLAFGEQLMQQGKQFYDAERFADAVLTLEQAVQLYQAQGDPLGQALALCNLSLSQQQLSNWTAASAAIQQSLALLNPASESELPDYSLAHVLAQAWDIQGRLYLLQGQAESALKSWQQAATAYENAGEPAAVLTAQINQANALQQLGFYRQSIQLLQQIADQFSSRTADSPADLAANLAETVALRSLATALLVAGDLPKSRLALEQSLEIAQQIAQQSGSNAAQTAIGAAYLGLGNLTLAEATARLSLLDLTPATALPLLNAPTPSADLVQAALQQRAQAAAQQFQQQADLALDFYQQAASQAHSAQTQLQAQLKQLHLLVETQQWPLALALYPSLQRQLNSQPASRSAIYNQIEFAQILAQLVQQPASPALSLTLNPALSLQAIAEILASAHQQAIALKDSRAQSDALGSLGELYETTQQWPAAQRLTEQALGISQALDAADLSYRWQWQLGRLLKAQGNPAAAVLAYQQAVETLQSLRRDLVAVNRDLQFSFRERVEPVYRELVELLLQPNAKLAQLAQARDVIEGLQVAELDNFFREACLDTQFQLDRLVDRGTAPAAIFYTILLSDRLEVILKLPEQALIHYSTDIPQATVEATADQFLNELKKPLVSQALQTSSRQLYDWLIRPATAALAQSQITTLVFVLDGALRSLPMAALWDGEHYLLERYSLAIAPGLSLPNPQPLQPSHLRALIAGLSEARPNFPALSFVNQEIQEIQADLPSQVLLNQEFTRDNFQQAVRSDVFPIVHIATHGQFSSNASETFILAWDQPLTVYELSQLLQANDLANRDPIELLVLSACQTAVGDRRATLGLAGVAVRAGARSTVASLWSLDDGSGALFMRQFYQELVNAPISKAEALRLAQQHLLADPQYQAPRFWAAYVLLGNWL